MSLYRSDFITRLHRMAFKLCVRCGKRKTIKASRSMWKRETKWLTCEKCREKERLRGQKRRRANGRCIGCDGA